MQSDNIITASQISTGLIFSYLLMHPVETISSITFMFIKEKSSKHFNFQRSLESPNNIKAVANAIVPTRLYIDINGFKELYMNNQYSAPDLFVILKTKYMTLACSTICTNRKGWDPKVMNLSKSATRGGSKTFYNPINRILFGQ